MKAQSLLMVLVFCAGSLRAFPRWDSSFDVEERIGFAETWIENYHYRDDLDEKSSEEAKRLKFRDGIKKMKRFFHISPIDGEITPEVMELMSEPRCQNADPLEDEDGGRSKRFSRLGNSVWTRLPVRIGFKSFLNSRVLSSSIQKAIAQECADLWAKNSGLSFSFVTGRPDIQIEYERMDGPYGTVGRGQSPTPWSDTPSYLRMDSSDQWKPRARDDDGVSFKAALCHEMGHTLGLGHSSSRDAVMYPSIQNSRDDGKLGSDDIGGIQALYGPNRGGPREETPRPSNPKPTKRPTQKKRKTKEERKEKKRRRQEKREQKRRRQENNNRSNFFERFFK